MQRKRRDVQRIQPLETKVNLAEIYAEFTHSDRGQPLNWRSTRQGLISPPRIITSDLYSVPRGAGFPQD